MSSDHFAIRVRGLGKKYTLGERESYKTLTDSVANALWLPMRKIRPITHPTDSDSISKSGQGIQSREFWALKDISLEIEPGEVIGIIGRNGAGKSTFLKILSRITTPTKGMIEIRGRVGSLLEVGTGFHPELTGYENIFLSGSIYGMKRREIEHKIDDIIKFSEIEKFLDTPVKRYSSGMYVRLAFAVAAHLQPEILLVDEVLAVGDAGFQKKCLGKMGDVAKEGRTILFVSHNMSAISSLCSRGILISNGQIIMDGNAREVTSEYQSMLYANIDSSSSLSEAERYGNGKARFTSVTIIPLDNENRPIECLQVGQNLKISLEIEVFEKILDTNIAIIIYTHSGLRIIDANTAMKNSFLSLEKGQKATVTFILQNVLLRQGTYLLGLWLGRANIEDIDGITYAKHFSVEINPHTTESMQSFPGIYLCQYDHSIKISP